MENFVKYIFRTIKLLLFKLVTNVTSDIGEKTKHEWNNEPGPRDMLPKGTYCCNDSLVSATVTWSRWPVLLILSISTFPQVKRSNTATKYFIFRSMTYIYWMQYLQHVSKVFPLWLLFSKLLIPLCGPQTLIQQNKNLNHLICLVHNYLPRFKIKIISFRRLSLNFWMYGFRG